MTPMSFTKLNVPLVKSLGLKLPPLFTKLNVCITIGQKVKHDRFNKKKQKVCKMLTQQLGDKKNLKLK